MFRFGSRHGLNSIEVYLFIHYSDISHVGLGSKARFYIDNNMIIQNA